MALRSGHGTGRGVPRVEILPPDELAPATPTLTARPDRDRYGRFLPGNKAGDARRVRPGPRGQIERVDPTYAPFKRWGQRFAAHRRRELALAHGGSISAGVGALVESAALALAASRFIQMKAAESADAELFRRANSLANDARQQELAAWELASREAGIRPPQDPHALLIAGLRKKGANDP